MHIPPIPSDEADRLRALRGLGILDSPPTESLDRLTALAAKLLNVPIALISLVDSDRQWFKSCIGLDAQETPRNISFCGHAVYERQVLAVSDATLDERFADNPLVVGTPHIRAYLGIPLFTVGGHPIGTVCAIDTSPRTFSEEQIAALSRLGKVIEKILHAQSLATPRTTSGEWWADRFPAWGAIGVAVLGCIVAFDWLAHLSGLVPFARSLADMKFNAAACIALCGFALHQLVRGQRRTVLALGGAVIAIASMTLVEYGFDIDLRLDQWPVRDYLDPAGVVPGRMAPQAAVAFLLYGIGLCLCAAGRHRTRRLATAALLSCLASILAVVGLCGHLMTIESAFDWGSYAYMALHTAVGLLVLGIAFLGWMASVAARERLSIRWWISLGAPLTLMVTVVLISLLGLLQLKSSYGARGDTYGGLAAAQDLQGDLTDLQHAIRGYVLTQQPEYRDIVRRAADGAPALLQQLDALAQDDPELRVVLAPLTVDVQRAVRGALDLLNVRDSQGLDGVIKLETVRHGDADIARLRVDLEALTHTLHQRSLARDTRAQENSRNTTVLLVVAILIAAILLTRAQIANQTELLHRRRAEGELQKISTLQRAVLDGANYAIISTEIDGTVTTFNATAEKWLGYRADEVVGKVTPLIWHDPGEVAVRSAELTDALDLDVHSDFDALVAKARLGMADESEWTLIRKGGSRFSGTLSASALYDANGAVSGYLTVLGDITQRKQQEDALRLSEERFRRAFDDAPIGIALVSPEGRWLQANRVLCDLLGYSEVELAATDFQTVTYPEDLEKDLTLVAEVLSGRRASYQMEKRYRHRDGRLVYAMLSVSLVRDPSGAPLYFISQIEDISERLKIARLKSEFVATVSHELRTPLTSIRGALGLLLGGVAGALPASAASMIRIAHQNCERLVLIINDILDLEKIEAGRLEVKLSVIDVAAVIGQAVALNRAYADKHNIHLVCDQVPALQVNADPDRLMQILTNLLSNATKFSPAGAAVHIRAFASGAWVRFEVEDRGIGIDEAFRARIFEKFAQAEASADRRFGGTGLGLAISKSLVERMGGRIGFISTVGRGTTFFVELASGSTVPQDRDRGPKVCLL
jgi:PAS domain S-box-containing protein